MNDYDYESTWDYEISCHDYLDETYTHMQDLDEEHPREHTDYQALAYAHYAWCTSKHNVRRNVPYDTLDVGVTNYTAHIHYDLD